MLSTDRQAEEELEDQEGSDGQDEPANVSLDGSLMDFEQELLNYSDIMPNDAAKPPTPALAEIQVNSEDLVNRVSDVVVSTMKREICRQSEANEALLSCIENKLDQILKQEPSNNKTGSLSTTTSKDSKVCYYCREQGHLAIKCKERVECIGCGTDQNPYDRCIDRTSACKKCDLVGHKNTVHETMDPVLRKKLYDSHPTEFFISLLSINSPKMRRTAFTLEQRKEEAAGKIQTGGGKTTARVAAGVGIIP